MRPRTRRLFLLFITWVLALTGIHYFLQWKDTPEKELHCQETENFKSSTEHWKSHGQLKKATDVGQQAGNKELRECIKSLANVRRRAREDIPDNVVPEYMIPGRENHHKQFWPSPAGPQDSGYAGSGVVINTNNLNDRERMIFTRGYEIYKVNQLATDSIGLRREIPGRFPECRKIKYDNDKLPQAGVVLVFYNELWSVLLRSVFSILDATPEDLLTEIILVDDCSTKEHLGRPLDDYLKIFLDKVKLVRLPQRKGLIQARLKGFDHVTGDVAVFLDAHSEVHQGWLEPLLQRITDNDSVIAVPVIDFIDPDTFQCTFTSIRHTGRGGFDWDLNYSWIFDEVEGVKKKNPVDPVKSATHSGCCFAVSKVNFKRLGTYDPELEIWGCENMELSFKSWMCGGSVEIIPCSHVSHMFRISPYGSGPEIKHSLLRNCIRVAEVWMDEYKEFHYERINQIQKRLDMGNITDRRTLREKLKCRSFDWYVKEIYPELYLPLNTSASGMISSVADEDICASIETRGDWDRKLIPAQCDPEEPPQHFILSKESQIRRDDACLLFEQSLKQLMVARCNTIEDRWLYTKDNLIMCVESGLCLALSEDRNAITMAKCRKSNKYHQWIWPRKIVELNQPMKLLFQ